MITTIFFDLHRTLIHAKESRSSQYQKICRERNLPVPPISQLKKLCYQMNLHHTRTLKKLSAEKGIISWEEDKELWFREESKIFTKLGIKEGHRELNQKLLEEYMNPENQKTSPQVYQVLAELKKRGYKLGILTNSDSRVRKILKHLSLEKYFKYYIISSEVGYKKPAPQLFHYAFDRYNLKAEEVAYIGDHYERDILAGKNAQLGKLVLYDPSQREEKKMQNPEECQVINSLLKLLDIFPPLPLK